MPAPVRITSWNVNGLRNAIRKDFGTYLDEIECDVLLLQEIRSTPAQLPDAWATPADWHVAWHPAERLGYAGTAVFSRHPITVRSRGMGTKDADVEGRVLEVATAGVRVVSVYAPSGSSGAERQAVKDAWMPAFTRWAAPMLRARTPTILGGDLNVAHTERDIFHWKSNQKSSGFLPHERAWVGALLDAGWADFVREHHGAVDGPYTWWSNRGQARQLDRGWRIDYLLGNRAAARQQTGAPEIHREAGLAVSDHAPVTISLAV
ncbi:MAG: exodeoxyribonuclease III [Phycisphaerales bacterium]